jgi:hypothetical protein
MVSKNKKYAIHPGYVYDKEYQRSQRVSFGDLVHLYRLNPRDCTEWVLENLKTWKGRNYDDYVHLGIMHGEDAYDVIEDQPHLRKDYEFYRYY